jgi:hypothetical protein
VREKKQAKKSERASVCKRESQNHSDILNTETFLYRIIKRFFFKSFYYFLIIKTKGFIKPLALGRIGGRKDGCVDRWAEGWVGGWVEREVKPKVL